MRTLILAASILLAAPGLVFAGAYLDLSLHQYHRFEPIERFQADTRIHIYHEDAVYRAGVEYSLFEAIDGPVSDHTLNLFVLYWSGGSLDLNALLVNDGPYDKADPYHDAMVETRVHLPMRIHGWMLDWVPMIRLWGGDGWRTKASLGVSASRDVGATTLELGINAQGPRDHYFLAPFDTAATVRARFPLWNDNRITLEYGRLLGSDGPERQWWTWRLELAHLAEF